MPPRTTSPSAARPVKPRTCDSYAYTNRRGGCMTIATKLLIVTFAERRTQRFRLCDHHTAGVHEDVADPFYAYLKVTGITETPLPRPAPFLRAEGAALGRRPRRPPGLERAASRLLWHTHTSLTSESERP